jgi:hypothetical protein
MGWVAIKWGNRSKRHVGFGILASDMLIAIVLYVGKP